MADFSSDVFFSSISELSARLRAKEFSCVELTRAFCDRLEKTGPRYNALALSLRPEALRQAIAVDYDLMRDRTRGPLQGIPYGAKDLLAVAKHGRGRRVYLVRFHYLPPGAWVVDPRPRRSTTA